MTQTHELKTQQPYFSQVVQGKKTFEIRRNDRDFRPGDTVVLREYHPVSGYTSESVTKRIGYVTSFEQVEDYCVFSLLPAMTPGLTKQQLIEALRGLLTEDDSFDPVERSFNAAIGASIDLAHQLAESSPAPCEPRADCDTVYLAIKRFCEENNKGIAPVRMEYKRQRELADVIVESLSLNGKKG